MRFHDRTLKLLDIAPTTLRSAVEALDAVEDRIGRKLPASVREWYSLDGACKLLLRPNKPLHLISAALRPIGLSRLTSRRGK
jgi:hypothetical protein